MVENYQCISNGLWCFSVVVHKVILVKYIYLLVLLSILAAFVGCKKAHYCDEPLACQGELMRLLDYSGLDGCGYVLEKDSQVYEPANLDLMDVTLRTGELYYVAFDTVSGASICMVEPLIEIDCISPLVLQPHE